MNNSKKRGFTIVELVIVIAVIAILAGVLIPTFTSIVKKANLSADEQAVRQMNTALQIYTAENGAPTSAIEVKKALDENLINTESMIPVTQGYAFYWDNENNKIVLVGMEDTSVVKSGWALLTSTGYGKVMTDSSAAGITAALESDSSISVANPALVKLESAITVDGTSVTTHANTTIRYNSNGTAFKKSVAYIVPTGKSLIVDLNDKVLNVTNAHNVLFFVEEGASLTVKNGTVKGDESTYLFATLGGSISLQDVIVESGLAAGYVNGIADFSMIDCTVNVSYYGVTSNSSDASNDGSRISISHSTIHGGHAGVYIGTYADVTIRDNCKISGGEHGAYFRGCNATISNSNIWNTGNDGELTSPATWSGGSNGFTADIVFACGGTTASGYISTATFKCENVTGNPAGTDDDFVVVKHQPAGGTVTVSGITVDKTFNQDSAEASHWGA